MNRLRFTRRLKCRIYGRFLGSEQITRIRVVLIFLELNCCHLLIGDLGAFLETLLSFLSTACNCDHAFGARHLQFEVHITWSSHETGIGWSAQNGVISTLEIHYLKRQLLFAVILLIAENHIKSDLAE